MTEATGRRPRVLVAEDDPANGELLLRLVAHRGWSGELVGDGLAACERALGGDWDLVLTDIQMPGADGLTVARRLRAHEAERATGPWRTPVVAVTAHALPAFRAEAREAGMDGFVEKPLRLAGLDAALGPFAAARPRVLVAHPSRDRRRRLGACLAAEGLGPFLAATPDDARGARPFDAAARAPAFGAVPTAADRTVPLGEDAGDDDAVAEALRALLGGASSAPRPPSSAADRDDPDARVAVDLGVVDLVPAFLERRRAEAAGVRRALDAADWGAVARLARSTAATAGGFGFARLAALGGELGRAARAEDRDAAAVALAALEAHLAAVRVTPAG